MQELNRGELYPGLNMLMSLSFQSEEEEREHSLVHDFVSLGNRAVVPFCSDNHHLNGQHESVPYRHK